MDTIKQKDISSDGTSSRPGSHRDYHPDGDYKPHGEMPTKPNKMDVIRKHMGADAMTRGDFPGVPPSMVREMLQSMVTSAVAGAPDHVVGQRASTAVGEAYGSGMGNEVAEKLQAVQKAFPEAWDAIMQALESPDAMTAQESEQPPSQKESKPNA